MSFEKEFPGLTKDCVPMNTKPFVTMDPLWSQSTIEMFCLSKQKVKETLMKWCPGGTLDHAKLCDCITCKLLKELGFEK